MDMFNRRSIIDRFDVLCPSHCEEMSITQVQHEKVVICISCVRLVDMLYQITRAKAQNKQISVFESD